MNNNKIDNKKTQQQNMNEKQQLLIFLSKLKIVKINNALSIKI